MTESDWANCADPQRMLAFLRGRGAVSDRKLRLFAVACVRHVWPMLADQRSRAAVELVEGWLEGRAGRKGLLKADRLSVRGLAYSAHLSAPYHAAAQAARLLTLIDHPLNPVDEVARFATGAPLGLTPDGELRFQAAAVRDVVGNPFRPATFDPAWRTDTVASLARQAHETRDFSLMPILADALQDAGCADDDILSHCRGGGPHVRGCHVVDRILDRS